MPVLRSQLTASQFAKWSTQSSPSNFAVNSHQPYDTLLVLLLGRVALVRGAAVYSHQTFPWTICQSVRRSVQCIVQKRRIRSGCQPSHCRTLSHSRGTEAIFPISIRFPILGLPTNWTYGTPLPFPPPLEVGPLNLARESGERCKLPSGFSPSRNQNWCILVSKYDIWWQQF